ncbi:MAG: nucleotidyltransferase domain-containing protein [Defluviitaleaceae bacterium]|nr:nucleotidyltransferase domain-containing protein [Defluviitaleaceae bacterium]
MTYTHELYKIDEIVNIVAPIAREYGAKKVTLFGSYASGNAKSDSDIDLHINKGEIKGLFRFASFQRELEDKFTVPVDVLITGSLSDEFLDRIKDEEVVIYEGCP